MNELPQNHLKSDELMSEVSSPPPHDTWMHYFRDALFTSETEKNYRILPPKSQETMLCRSLRLSDSDANGVYLAQDTQLVTETFSSENIAQTGYSTHKQIVFPVDYLVSQIRECHSSEEIIAQVSLAKLHDITNRLKHLLIQTEADSERQPISLESIQDFAQFFVSNQQLRSPLIGVTRDGYLQAEWHLEQKRHIVLKFLGGQANRLAIIKPLPIKKGKKKSYLIQLSLSEVYKEMSELSVISWLEN